MIDSADRLRIVWRDRDSAFATHLRRDIVQAARCCESRLREAAHFAALYPNEFEDFGGLRRSAEFWSGLAFDAANTLQRLYQLPRIG